MVPLAFIIVLNWNGRHHLQDCLDSLSLVEYPEYRILLVDNDSHDGSVPFVHSNYPRVQVIQNDRNLGFAEGNNVGIRFALSQAADYVVLLNNDTRVEPDFLTHLIQRGEEKPEIGVLGGKVLMFANPRIINSTGVNLNQFAYGWDRDFGKEDRSVKRERGEVLAVTGSLMAIKREVVEQVGLLDPKFFTYFEDVDFCIRVWKYTPFTVEYVPEAIIYHKFSSSGSGEPFHKTYFMLRNQYKIFFKHFPLSQVIRIFPTLSLHRLGTFIGRLGRMDFLLPIVEFLILLKYWMLLPLMLLRRLPEPVRGISSTRFWKKIISERKIPSIKSYVPGYERIFSKKQELGASRIPDRIVIGVNDEILGEGWSRINGRSPRMRRVGERALCFLRNEKRFEYLQVHGLCDFDSNQEWIEVTIEGELVGRRRLERGWKTYIIPFTNHFNEGTVEVCLRTRPSDLESGFAVNEIGLFSLGSPLLRLVER